MRRTKRTEPSGRAALGEQRGPVMAHRLSSPAPSVQAPPAPLSVWRHPGQAG